MQIALWSDNIFKTTMEFSDSYMYGALYACMHSFCIHIIALIMLTDETRLME